MKETPHRCPRPSARPTLASLWVLVALAALAGDTPARAGYCPPPQYEDTYVLNDGTLVDVYVQNPGFYGESCMPGGTVPNTSGNSVSPNGHGNSAGTASFETVGTSAQQRAACTVHFADGTAMKMNGLPRISNGRFAFTNDLGQLVQLPLEEVRATDSGRHYQCGRCARDTAGRPLPSLSVRDSFVAAHPCPSGGSAETCPGYAVDHVTPIVCGGEDEVDNLQWQTLEQAGVKKAWVAKACGH